LILLLSSGSASVTVNNNFFESDSRIVADAALYLRQAFALTAPAIHQPDLAALHSWPADEREDKNESHRPSGLQRARDSPSGLLVS